MRRSLAAAFTTAAMALAVAPAGAAHAQGQLGSEPTPTGQALGEVSKTAVESATPELPTDKLVTSNVPLLN